MISLGVSHQTSHEVLGHYVIHNVPKFQSGRSDNKFFIGEKPSQKNILTRTITALMYYNIAFVIHVQSAYSAKCYIIELKCEFW